MNMKEELREIWSHLSVKIAVTVLVELCAISFVLDVWSVLIR